MVQFYLWRQDDKGANIIWITNKSTTPWAVLGVIPYTHVWLLGWSSTSLWQRHSFFTSCFFFFGSWFFYIFFDYFLRYNWHMAYSSSRGTAWLFNICIYCKMTGTVSLISVCPHTQLHFFLVIRNLRSTLLATFQICHVLLLLLVSMLCLIFPWLIFILHLEVCTLEPP